ncbi:MAG: hypothetical protein WEC59_07630 [Salibacteraceae bacterium]
MKNLVVISFALLLAAPAFAQKTYGPTNDSLYLGFYRDSISQLERPTFLIVPFHPDRYMSEIDRKIAEGTNYTYLHTRGFFRKGLDNAILIAAKEHNNYVNLHADDPALNMDLDFVYHLTKNPIIPYEPPIIKEDQGFKKRIANYWLKLQGEISAEPEPGTRVEEGQIVTVSDSRELITKVKVINPKLTDSLTAKHNVDYYLFINELDMLVVATDQRQLESDDYGRVIKAHMTVLDKDGNELFSLIKREWFSSLENDLEQIIRNHFLPLGSEIVYALDSYRFLQAGLSPIIEEQEKKSIGQNIRELAPLQKLKSNDGVK